MENDDLDLDFDFDSDDPVEEADGAAETPPEKEKEQAPAEEAPPATEDSFDEEDDFDEEDSFDDENDDFDEEDDFDGEPAAAAPPKPAKPPKPPRPPLPKKTRMGIIVGAAVVVLAVAATLLVMFGLTPRERHAAAHVRTLLAEAVNPDSFVLFGDIVTVEVYDARMDGRAAYLFIHRRETSPAGFPRRTTAIFWNDVLLGDAEIDVRPEGETATEEEMNNELHRRRARRQWESWNLRIAQAEAEGERFEPSPEWLSHRTVSGRRVARRLGIAWEAG